MSTPLVAVSAIVEDDDDLLLVRRARDPQRGRWAVPGGHLQSGETLSEAVLRELREETGIIGVCGELLGIAERLPPGEGQPHHVILAYRVHLLERHEPEAGDDADDARWVPRSLVAEMDLVGGLAGFLADHDVIDTIA